MATKVIRTCIRSVLNIQPENETVNSEFITIVNSHIVYNKLGKSTSLASNTIPSESNILICSPPVATLNWKGLSGLDWHSYCLGKSLANKKNWQWQISTFHHLQCKTSTLFHLNLS